MLTRFDRYLLRTLVTMSILALLFLLTADFIIQVSADADDVGKGHFTLGILLLQHVLTLPLKFSLFAPAAVLIGTIMGLGQLSAQQELTIVQAAGVARWRLVRGAVVLALLVGGISLANSEYLAPQGQEKSELLRHQALGQSSALSRAEGIWLRQDADIVHIAGLGRDGSLRAVRLYHFLPTGIEITEAPRAHYEKPLWRFEQPRRFRTTPAATVELPANPVWHNATPPATLQQLARRQQGDTLREMYTVMQFLAANGLDDRSTALRFWQRVFTPLTIFAMVLLALPFGFGNVRAGQQGTRLVAGIFLGVAYYVVSGIIANLALLLGWPAFLGAILPVALFSLLPLWLLNKQ